MQYYVGPHLHSKFLFLQCQNNITNYIFTCQQANANNIGILILIRYSFKYIELLLCPGAFFMYERTELSLIVIPQTAKGGNNSQTKLFSLIFSFIRLFLNCYAPKHCLIIFMPFYPSKLRH